MSSGWIVNYKDGIGVILSERKYQEFKQKEDGKFIESEEHWFDMKQAIEKYPYLEVFE
jgi:hypothetical protein